MIYFVYPEPAVPGTESHQMNAQVGKWGNSLAVRNPGTYAKEMALDEGAELTLTRVKGGLLLCPAASEESLKELLKQVKPENIHGETGWGSAVGREAW